MSSILDQLGGGAAAGGPAGPSGGGAGIPGQPDNPDAQQDLSDAIDALKSFLDNEEDDQDKSVAAACLAKLQTILGTRQKQDEAAAGVTPVHKAMGRAYSSQGQ